MVSWLLKPVPLPPSLSLLIRKCFHPPQRAVHTLPQNAVPLLFKHLLCHARVYCLEALLPAAHPLHTRYAPLCFFSYGGLPTFQCRLSRGACAGQASLQQLTHSLVHIEADLQAGVLSQQLLSPRRQRFKPNACVALSALAVLRCAILALEQEHVAQGGLRKLLVCRAGCHVLDGSCITSNRLLPQYLCQPNSIPVNLAPESKKDADQENAC
mmetsp:Transcript_18504/g.51932  ORF Transcript_18504/g.51932 Transcript_18504/m.51932 type:complete len:212 (-) Transcript_18504:2299-2934(-)